MLRSGQNNSQNPQNTEMIGLGVLFALLMWLLYTLSVFIHKTSKIHREIEAVRVQNQQMQAEIKEKQEYLDYLRTAERIEKEAKMQLGRKRPEEQVLIVFEEKKSLIENDSPLLVPIKEKEEVLPEASHAKKWEYLLFGRK